MLAGNISLLLIGHYLISRGLNKELESRPLCSSLLFQGTTRGQFRCRVLLVPMSWTDFSVGKFQILQLLTPEPWSNYTTVQWDVRLMETKQIWRARGNQQGRSSLLTYPTSMASQLISQTKDSLHMTHQQKLGDDR